MERFWLKSYPPGMPADVTWDEFKSVGDLFEKSAAKFAARPAYHCMGKTLSFAEIEKMSRDFAAWLQAKGLTKGARVAMVAVLPSIAAILPRRRVGGDWARAADADASSASNAALHQASRRLGMGSSPALVACAAAGRLLRLRERPPHHCQAAGASSDGSSPPASGPIATCPRSTRARWHQLQCTTALQVARRRADPRTRIGRGAAARAAQRPHDTPVQSRWKG